MSSEGDSVEPDLKMFMKAIQEQFKVLNMRLDNLESPSKSKLARKITYEEEGGEDSEHDEVSSSKGKRGAQKHDSNLGNIKMKIPAFQGKNDPELYLEWGGR